MGLAGRAKAEAEFSLLRLSSKSIEMYREALVRRAEQLHPDQPE
jgi:hypothetical protein